MDVKDKPIIHICTDGTNDSIFICGVYGEIDIPALNSIEKGLLEWAYCDQLKAGVHKAICTYVPEIRGEYGIIEQPSWWDINYFNYTPFKGEEESDHYY